MKLIFWLGAISSPLLMFFMFSCKSTSGITQREVENAEAIKTLVNIFNTKHGFVLGAEGGSSKKGKTESIILGFDSIGSLTKEEARRQMVTIEEEALDILNHDKRITLYLQEESLQPKNLDIFIIQYLPNGNVVSFPNISRVSSFGNKVNFYTYLSNEEDADYRNELEESEPYDEALKIVLEEKVEPGARWQLSPDLKERIRQRLAAKAQVKPETMSQD